MASLVRWILAATLLAGLAYSARAPRGWRASAAPGRSMVSAEPFRAAGLYWQGASEIRMRVSADGRSWTDWIAVHAEYEVGAEHASDVVFFDAPQRIVEVSGPARVFFIDPGEGPKTLAAAPGLPEWIARSAWCPDNACPQPPNPTRTTPSHMVVHHTAGANTASDWNAVMRSIWVLHVQGNGWADIGYNFLIDPEGRIYDGRGDGVLGAHFSGVNTGTMGVSLMGTFSVTEAPEAMFDALRKLLAWQADRYGIDAGGRSLHAASGLAINNISGHRDAGLSPRATSTTECPGNAVYARLPELRRQVRLLVEDDCPLTISQPVVCAEPAAQTLRIAAASACPLRAASEASWLTAAAVAGALELSLDANPGERRTALIKVNRQAISVTQAAAGAAAPPCLAFDGVRGAAAFDDRPAAPGGLVSLFGANLSSQALAAPQWPSELAGVQVLVNGRPAPLAFVSPAQINFQLPASVSTGSASLVVRRDGVDSPERLLWVTEATPALFSREDGEPLLFDLAGSLLPQLAAGSRFVVYLTGAGRAGLPAAALLGGSIIPLLELAPVLGVPGLSRAVLDVPAATPPGVQPLSLRIAGVPSPPLPLTVTR